jgi:cold shock CspA family protein
LECSTQTLDIHSNLVDLAGARALQRGKTVQFEFQPKVTKT